MTCHFLKLNSEKTEFLEINPFRRSDNHFTCIEFDDVEVPACKSAKSLGVYFDSTLSFEKQVNETVRICNYRLMNMSRIASKLDKDLKTTLVQSYILSKLDYCNSLYTSINKTLLNKMQSVQNASAYFIFGMYNNTGGVTSSSCDDLLKDLHFLPIQYRIMYKISLTCFKCINDFAPIYLKELINPTVCTGYNLRVDSDLFRLNVLKKPHYRKS